IKYQKYGPIDLYTKAAKNTYLITNYFVSSELYNNNNELPKIAPDIHQDIVNKIYRTDNGTNNEEIIETNDKEIIEIDNEKIIETEGGRGVFLAK
ncbi:10308_t:CDS:2, partial [Diversispora eburnea]